MPGAFGEAGELTQGDVKELYAKAQEAQPDAEPRQETPDKDTFSIYLVMVN